jgi:tripartite-type tricarboxylate transporter receptor subunit TctC
LDRIGIVGASAGRRKKSLYAGKTVRMIVGCGTGGGHDIFSRLIAPYLTNCRRQ